MAEHEHGRTGRGPRRRRRSWAWLAAIVALLVVAGVAGAVYLAQDDDEDVTEQVRQTGGDALDTATEEGGDAVEAVTEEGGDAVEAITGEGDDAVDGATGGDDPSQSIVEEDPVVKRLARGRELPFTAGPWTRERWRDGVYDRLSEPAKARATKVDVGDGFGIRFE